MRRQRPIIQHLLLLVLAATLPLLALILFNLHERIQQTTEQIEETLLDAAGRTAFDADRFTQLSQVMLSGLAARPLVRALDAGRCDPELGNFLTFLPAHAGLLTVAADGRLVCAAVAPRAGATPTVEPSHFLDQAKRSRSFTVGPLERDAVAGTWRVTMAQPIVDDQGQIQGVVAVAVDLLTFSKTRNAGASSPHVITGIIDSNGSYISRSVQPEQWLGKSSKGLASARVAARSRPARVVTGTGADGVERMFSFAPVRGTDWKAFAAVPLNEVYAAQWRSAALSGALALLITALAAALSVWMTRRISRPIKAIAEAAAQVSQGRWSVRVGPGWPTEIADVAARLDQALAQRLAAEDALRDSKEDLAVTLDSIADGVIATDLQGRITGMNPTAERLTGWTSLQARGQPLAHVFRCLDPHTRQPAADLLQQVLSDDQDVPMVENERLLARDGHEYRISKRAAPIRTPSGQIRGMVLVFGDVTAQHAERMAHARDAELLRQVGKLAKVGGWQLQLATMQLDWSDELYRIHELDPGARVVFGQGLEYVMPEARPVIQRAIQAAMADGTPWDLELPLVAASDGRQPWVHSQGTALRQDGKIVRVTGAVQDITERKRAQRELDEQRQRMMAIVDSAMDGVISVDPDERIVIFNAAAESMFGCSAAEVLGQTLDRFIPLRYRVAHHEKMRAFGRTGKTPRPMAQSGTSGALRTAGLRVDGEEFPIEASISSSIVFGQTYYTAILRDVTERVQAAQALMDQRLELSALTHRLMTAEEKTNRALAQALHDQLGQTLSALRLSFDAFEGVLPREAMAVTEHWRARLSDLIDRSVVEVREVLVDLRPALLEEMGLAAAIENELSTQALVAGDLSIVFEPDDSILDHRWPEEVEHAAFMITREAVANAALHSGATRIDVRLTHGSPELQLTVHDNGRGLALERRRSKPGHLGMIGMRERAVAIGGQLRVQSSPGEGTTITLRWSLEA